MVSHDRYLIEACADQLWVVADHAVTNFDGDLDDYRRLVLSARGQRVSPRERSDNERGQDRGQGRDRPEPDRNETKAEKRRPLKQKISDAEAEIARISGIIEKIDAALALPDIFSRDPKQAAQLGKARASAASALQRVEEQWLEASAEYDGASSQSSMS
jgi:ATP-binding cassette subfamily F protein 3